MSVSLELVALMGCRSLPDVLGSMSAVLGHHFSVVCLTHLGLQLPWECLSLFFICRELTFSCVFPPKNKDGLKEGNNSFH